MRTTKVLSAIMLLSAIACGSSSDSVTGTNNNGNNNSASGPLSATIDGKAWASATPAVVRSGNIISIAGLDNALTAAVSFAVAASGPGTFSLAFANSTGGLGIVTKGSQGWASALQGGTGSVTFTTVTANHVVGTFAFDAVGSSGGATGTVHVTNGKFDITF
jgi:hypothetical protein